MKNYFFLLFFLSSYIGFAQFPTVNDTVYNIVEEMPDFPGGMSAMNSFIANNLKLPDSEKIKGVHGYVNVTFVIDENGNVCEVKVAKNTTNSSRAAAEAVRVVKSMPKWTPGKQGGKFVKVSYYLPVKFT